MTDSNAPVPAPSYRGLLALVIILGVLILLGVGALIAGAMLGWGRNREPGSPYLVQLAAPGAHIESAELQGNRILLRLVGGASGEELVVLDSASGRVIGRVTLNAKP